jgi:hypothetical protein
MNPNQPLPRLLEARLRAFARREWQVALMRVGGEGFCVGGGLWVLAAVFLAVLRPGEGGRIVLSGCALAFFLGFLVWRGWSSLARRRTPFALACALEAAAQGRLRERWMSAVEFTGSVESGRGTSPWMLRETVAIAEQEAGTLDPVALVSLAPARRAGLAAMGVAAILLVLALLPWTGSLLRLVLYPAGSAAVLARTQLHVTPGDGRMRLGEAVDIQATAQPWPDGAVVEIRWDDGFRERLAMKAVPGTNCFTMRLVNVAQGFRYRVQAGDAESLSYRIGLQAPPRLDRVRLDITPPSYAGGAQRNVAGGDADVLVGSRVKILAELGGEPAKRAWLLEDGAPDRPLVVRENHAETEVTVQAPLAYGFRIEGRNGEVNQPSQRWFLRAGVDQPPSVAMAGEGLDTGFASAEELLLLRVEARDDLGLQRLSLISVLNGTNTDAEPLRIPPGPAGGTARETHASAALDLLSRRATPGDELVLRVEATDTAGQVGIAGPVVLQLSPPDLARLAQLATRLREQELRVEVALDQLREIRAAWFALSRSVADDSEDARRDLELLRARIRQWPQELREAGDAIETEARRASLPASPTIGWVGANLRAWGDAAGRMLGEAAETTMAAAGPPRVASFGRGKDLFDRALEDGTRARRFLLTAVVGLDTEVLAARSEVAQGRYRRALPVVRVSHGLESTVRPGLFGEFFAGVNKSLVFRTNDVPHLDNFDVPGHGRNAWSVRYTGELYVPETGNWTLGVLADDGVRVSLDGKGVTPAEAWREHPATEYRTNLTLTGGWHPLVLEMYQVGGESKLRLLLGRQGRSLNEVPRVQLRSPGTDLREIERQVATLSKEALRSADERAVGGLGAVAPVPLVLASLTNDLPHEGLSRLAAESRAPGAFVRTHAPELANWTLGLSRDLEQKADTLVNYSRDARNMMRGEMDQLRWKVRGPAPLRTLRVAMDALRDSAENLRRIAGADKTRAGKRAAQDREAAIAAAWSRELARSADQLADRFFDRAREDGHQLAERSMDLIASTRLEREVAEAAKQIDAALASSKSAPDEMAGQVQQNLDRIERNLGDVNRAAEVGQQGDSARLASEAAREMRAWDAARGDPAAEAKAHGRLREAVSEVARSERMRGNSGGADGLERAVSTAPSHAKREELAGQLRNVRNALPHVPESVASLPPPPLREQAQAIGKNSGARTQAPEALARPRLALAVEGERARRTGDAGLARAYERLGRDLGQLLQRPSEITQPGLDRLADRAEALAGARGGDARQKEIAQSSQPSPPGDASAPEDAEDRRFADRLDRLAGQSRDAAGESSKRPALMKDLEHLGEEGAQPEDSLEQGQGKPRGRARAVASAAAREASGEIGSAPKEWSSYQAAAGTLGDAAERLRIGRASAETASARPPQQAADGEPSEGPSAAAGVANAPGPKRAAPGDGEQGTQRDPGDASGLASSAKGEDLAAWARLSARLQQSIRSSSIEHFGEEQQEAIRAYYRRLGEGR